MSVIKWRIGVMAVIVAVVIAAACGGSEETSSEPTAVPPTEAPAPTATPKPTESSTTSEEQPTTSEQPTPIEQEAVATEPPVEPEPTEETESEIPYDVPVMEGATELVIQRETGSVTYVLEDTDIENVVEFYKDTMIEQGWETKTSSEIGLMATLVFETDQARTSVSLQANNIARTVTVRLFIFEK